MHDELSWAWAIGTVILWLAALGVIAYAIVGLVRRGREDHTPDDDRRS